MDSENQNSNNEPKRANTGPIVEDVGEDSPSDQTIRKIASVDPEDVHLALKSHNAAASTETGLVQFTGSSPNQEMPPCLQDFITSAATGKQLATMGQQVMPCVSESNAVIQSLSNVSNAVVAGSITTNVYKTTNVVAPEGTKEPSALTNLIARTKKRLEKLTKETTLVETRAASAARTKLKTGWVVIDGPCKSGKTCVGFHLLNTFDETYIPLYVTKDSELKTILDLNTDHQGETSKQKTLIIFIDEILKPNMHESLQEILEQVSGGMCHLILTTSSEKRQQKHYKEFDFILKKPHRMVSLMDYPLQENERYEMFKCSETRLHWLKQNSEGMREFLVQQIAKVTDYPWYLQLLQDLESTKRGSVDIVGFFSQPTYFLENIFKNMFDHNIEKFLSLVIIMSQGYLTDSKKCDPQSPHYDMYSALKSEYGNEMPSMKKLRDRADDMKGEFLLLADNKFVFIHGSITEPLCRVFFSEHPDLGIEWCPLPFLISMTTTGNSSVDDPFKLKLSKDEEDLLVQRFSRENPSSLFEILKHPGFSDPQFHEKCIKDLPILKDHYSDILMQAITLKQMPLVKEILKYLRTIGSKGSGIKLSALEKACKVGNDEAFCELIDVGVEPNHACMEACQHGKNEKILSYLLNHFGRHSSLLSHDVMRIQSDIIAEVGHAGMIKTLIDQLQEREDRPQLLERMLKKIVSLGSVDKYHFLIDNCDKTSLNYKDLLIAASTGSDANILSDLLKSFDDHVAASDESQDLIKESYLEACKANNKEAAELLHERDKDWATQEENFTTALHFAASVGFKQNPTTLMWLLGQCHNSGKDLTDSSGSTALHTACLAGNIESVNALLKADFNPLHQDNHGNTPLHVHFMGDFINRSIVEKLLWQDEKLRRLLKTKEENEAKEKNMMKMLCIQNLDGDTPLHLLCRKMNSLNMPILNMMLKNKKGTNLQNKEGKMPLHELIASNGCAESVSALLQNGAKLDMSGNQLQGIVHLACQIGNDSTIKNIFKAAKEARNVVECLDSQRKEPLHCYVSHPGSPEIVKLLCTEKTVADSDENGLTALDIAVSVCGNVEVVKELLKHGARTNYEDKASVLHHLCNSAHEDCQEMARLLIDEGADVNAVDQDLKTPLHIAASSSGPEGHSLVKLLLKKQVDIWKKDVDGMNPIHCCCLSSCQESSLSLRVLLDHTQIQRQLEAALTARANHGDTPLHMVSISSGKYRIEIARMLIEEGADVSLTNFDGDSALDLSQRQENTDLTMLLTEAVLINACKEEDKLSHAERILARLRQHDLLNTRDKLNRVFCTIAQTNGKYTRSVLGMLIMRGADVKCKTDEGCTVIHLAASAAGEYAEEIIAYFISKGINVTEKDYSGQTAIHKVCCGKTKYCKDLITFLHQQGVNVEDRDHMGNTPLHTLFGSLGDDYQECLEELLVLIVDPNVCAKNCKGISPCDMAKDSGTAVLLTFFDAYCSNVETLRQRPLKSFLTCGVNLNTKDEEGNTVLHKICKKKTSHTYENVNLLLNLGADRTLCNKKDETACDVARETGLNYNVIEMLEPEVLDTDGASISPQSPRPQQALPCPDWFQRSPSTEGWQHDLRRGMQGIREAAGMRYFDNSMDEFEKEARWKLNNHFNRFM